MRTFGHAVQGGADRPATNDTLYTIFSCTKAIMSSAAWLLIGEGKLDVRERAAEIVPEFGTNGKDVVTVEQLLLHTAGFPNAPYRAERMERSRQAPGALCQMAPGIPAGRPLLLPSDRGLLGDR